MTQPKRRAGRRRGPGANVPQASESFVGWVDLGPKGGRIVYRSGYERDALLLLRMDRVARLVERNDLTPLERMDFGITRSTPNRVFALSGDHLYTPDLRVLLQDGSEVFVEVGPHSRKTEAAEAAKLEEAKVEATKAGATLIVMTDRNMRGFRLENARRLFGSLHPVACPAELEARLRATLSGNARLTADETIEPICAEDPSVGGDLAEEVFWGLIGDAASTDCLDFDLGEKRIDAASRFRLATAPIHVRSYLESLIDGSHVEPTDWVAERVGHDAELVVTSVLNLTDEDLKEYQRRLGVVRDRQIDRAQTWEELGARHGVTARFARYWWDEFEGYGEVELRPHQRKLTGPRVPVAMLELFESLFRSSRTHRVKAILDSASMRGLARELGCRMSYDQAKRYARELGKNPTILARRTGKKRVPLEPAFGPVDRFREIVIPLQVVQVDATPVDIQTLGPDEESLTQRIWILTAVDVASRCFWAWRVCELEPTEIDFLKLVQMGIRDKDALAKAYGAYTPYPIQGVPQRIVTDRGWPFLGKTTSVRLTERGIVLEQAAPYRPEMKGVVERLFRTMNERFIHRLPGTTKSNPQLKGGRDAAAEARAHRLTVAKFNQYYGRAIIDGYSDEVHSSLGCTPLEKWDKLVKQWGRARPWPSDPASALLLSLLPLKAGGTRHREGSGYQFMNRIFRPLKSEAPDVALVLYDPDDLRSIVLVDPATGAVCCEAQVVGLDCSAPIDEETLAELNRPAVATRPRKGREALSDIVAEVEAGKATSRRGASRHAKALRVVKEKSPTADVNSVGIDAEITVPEEPLELELDAQPDYAA